MYVYFSPHDTRDLTALDAAPPEGVTERLGVHFILVPGDVQCPREVREDGGGGFTGILPVTLPPGEFLPRRPEVWAQSMGAQYVQGHCSVRRTSLLIAGPERALGLLGLERHVALQLVHV